MSNEPQSTANYDLPQGFRLSHYRIGKKLGRGGMGMVFEALDETLQRTVAIKVILPSATGELDRKRFTREALAASSLNHPNIVTVYEIGSENGMDFLVMERVKGETLRHAMHDHGMPPREVIRLAIQIADALATAHEAGIVHRDLTPRNVMITDTGLVKVLDFGLAKRVRSTPGLVGPEDPTFEYSLTTDGRGMGTVFYMSPEQATGGAVDARSDIFSFGSVLYELLTGRRAFEDVSHIGTLGAILHKDVTLDAIPVAVPRSLLRLIARCLEKKPALRWHSMADIRRLLEDIARDLDGPPETPVPVIQQRRTNWLLLAAVSLASIVAALGIAKLATSGPATQPSRNILRILTTDSGLSAFPALSADGKLLAFSSDRGKEGNLDIWLQQIGGSDPIRLTSDPADESDPEFSPDGTRIAFRSERNGGGIYLVPTLGGDPVLLAPGGRNPKFSPDGKWIAYWSGTGGVWVQGSSSVFVVDATGGQPRPVHAEMATSTFPVWSPRGDRLLVLGRMNGKGPFQTSLDWWVIPLEGGTPKQTGAQAIIRANNLTATLPQVRPLALHWRPLGDESKVAFSAVRGDSANLWEITLASGGAAKGLPQPLTDAPGRILDAAWSSTAASSRLAFTAETLNFDIWGVPIDPRQGLPKGPMQRLTEDPTAEWSPSLSADGKKLSYFSRRSDGGAVRLRDMETGKERTVTTGSFTNLHLTANAEKVLYSTAAYDIFSVPTAGGLAHQWCKGCGTLMGIAADGSALTYEPLENEDLLMLDAGHQTVKLAPRPGDSIILAGGRFSPDGRWVTFHTLRNSSGATDQIYVLGVDRQRPVPSAEWIPITDGKVPERDPAWAPDGSMIYYTSDRDGFHCIWARRLDPATKQPRGDPQPVLHFHTARRSLNMFGTRSYLTGLSVGGGWMVFSMAERTANIWLKETAGER